MVGIRFIGVDGREGIYLPGLEVHHMQVCFPVPDREGSIIGYREKQVFTVGRYLGMAGGAIMLLGIPYGLDPLAPFFGIFMERYAA